MRGQSIERVIAPYEEYDCDKKSSLAARKENRFSINVVHSSLLDAAQYAGEIG